MAGEGRRNMYPLALGGAVLLVVAAVVLGVQLLGGNDEDDQGAVATAPADLPTATATAGDTGSSAASSGGSGEGTDSEPTDAAQPSLTAGSVELLPFSRDGLADAVGQEVSGVRLTVVDVAEDEGFFVGRREGDAQRLFVDYDEGSYVPSAGDIVSLRGDLRRAPSDPASELDLDAEQARSVSEQDAYVVARAVTPQGAKTGGAAGSGASGDADSNAPPGDRP